MSLIFNLFYLTLLAFLGLESILYPGFVQKHFLVNPYILLVVYSLYFNLNSFYSKVKLKKYLTLLIIFFYQ